jgi:hypothetical protein
MQTTEEQQRIELSREQHKRDAAINAERRKQEKRALAEARAREEERAQKVTAAQRFFAITLLSKPTMHELASLRTGDYKWSSSL